MKHSAILLAGGLSSRMGQDKALLTQQGVTLLQSAYSKITEAMKFFSEARVIVSGNYPEYSGIADQIAKHGPIEGLWSCTRCLDYNSAVLVFPVDMPHLTPEQFKLLFAQIEQEHIIQQSDIEFVQFENWEMPFVFIYNSESEKILSTIRNYKDKSKRSIRCFKTQLRGKIIKAEDQYNFININTPAEWKEASQ